jgi:hypothetical protein
VTVAIAALLPWPLGAQQPAPRPERTRGLVGGAGHSWRFGIPGWGKTTSDLTFVAFHPRLGWFVTERLELFGEATVLAYVDPGAIALGVGLPAGRYYFGGSAPAGPYATGGVGLLWTSLTVPEIDRVFNFQIFYGIGLRRSPPRGPTWIVELRNHHISNAGTAGMNLGVNALQLLGGVEWVLR